LVVWCFLSRLKTFLTFWATLGYFGLACASMLTGTGSSERARARFSIF
jgi:hypothetical protein